MKLPFALLVIVVFASAAPRSLRLGFRNLYKHPIRAPGQSDKTPRIIGGQEVTPHSIPYAAFLEFSSKKSAWYCGGSLISENYVVTAGHCGYTATEVTVILGAHRPLDIEDSQFEVLTSGITVHENYDNEEITNDIAVVRLSTPVDFDDYIQPVSLPSLDDASNDFVDVLATASGWGLTDGHGTTPSEELNSVELTVISNQDCQTYFGSLLSSILCTSGLEDGGVCGGDGGGPLVTNEVLIGVVSFGVPYCIAGYPSAFTRVTSFLDWLGENTDVVIG